MTLDHMHLPLPKQFLVLQLSAFSRYGLQLIFMAFRGLRRCGSLTISAPGRLLD
jgi:hypothetical protein